MTGANPDLLAALREAHVFDPVPMRRELATLHVPFDDLAPGHDVESALHDAVFRGERVALLGPAGSGKSSALSYVLGPTIDGIVPIEVPVSVEDDQVATDPIRFVGHVMDITAELIRQSFPGRARGLPRPVAHTRTDTRRGGLAVLGAELMREVQTVVEGPRTTTPQLLQQAGEMLQLLSSAELMPVLVLDDTDKWIQYPGATTDVVSRRAGFFANVLRVVPEYLPCATVVAVHPEYRADAGWDDARGFLEVNIVIPELPQAAGIAAILLHRARVHLGDRVSVVDDFVTVAAIERIFDHYATGDARNVRTGVMQVMHTALSLACDGGSARVGLDHVADAIG